MLLGPNLQLVITSKTNKGCRRYYRDSSLVFPRVAECPERLIVNFNVRFLPNLMINAEEEILLSLLGKIVYSIGHPLLRRKMVKSCILSAGYA